MNILQQTDRNNPNQNEVVIYGGTHKYMGEFMAELPENAMLNKVVTGCGGTTIALKTDPHPYVICVPYIPMIKNKETWCAINNVNLLGVYGGITKEDIQGFDGNKYLVTWDSLGKLTEAIDPSKFKILIDESHKLIDAGSFRGEAIERVLENYHKYKSYTFMTATPIPDEFQHKELIHIPKYRIKWENLHPVTIEYKCLPGSIEKAMAVIGMKFLTDGKKWNAHIFINSVDLIIKTIKILKEEGLATPENTNIICAQNPANQILINKELGSGYRIKQVGEVNKVNFYTSTAFEGSDVFDENGRIFIATDGRRDHTKNDILVTLPQVIGRVRNSKYKYQVTLIYTSSLYFNGLTEAEFRQQVEQSLKQAEDTVKDFNMVSPNTKQKILLGAETDAYLIERNGVLKVNYTAKQNELFSFRTMHTTYFTRKDHKDKDIVIISNDITYNYKEGVKDVEFAGANKLALGYEPDFTELCKTYVEDRESLTPDIVTKIKVKYPIIDEALELIGADKIKAVKYRKIEIEREVVKAQKLASVEWKIVKLLNYKVGQWIAANELKTTLQGIYDELGIPNKAKATDIYKWYDVKSQSKWDKNIKKAVKGLTIITLKFNINSYKKVKRPLGVNALEAYK